MAGGVGNLLQAAPIVKHPLKRPQFPIGPGQGGVPATQSQPAAHVAHRLAGASQVPGDVVGRDILKVQLAQQGPVFVGPWAQVFALAALLGAMGGAVIQGDQVGAAHSVIGIVRKMRRVR